MLDDYRVVFDEKHPVRFIGGPIDNPESNAEIFFRVGRAAASWARMEQHIDAILIQINRENHSDEILDLYNSRHPGTFDDKIKMLKRYFNRHPGLAKHKDTVIDCATGLKALSKDRNKLLHRVLEDYDPTRDVFVLNGTQYRPKTDDFLSTYEVFPAERFRKFTELVNLAHYRLCEVSKDLFVPNVVAQLQRPRQPVWPWWRRTLDRIFR